MRRSIKLLLLACASVTALAFASPALAAYSPQLLISTSVDANTGNGVTDVRFRQTVADDPTLRVVIYAPVGFTASLGQAPGTQIGTLNGSVQAGALAGAIVAVEGTVTTGDPTLPVFTTSPCAPGQHTAIWLLNVTAAGQSLPAPVPMFIDTTTGAEAALGSTKLTLCLPHPSVANLGIKLLDATLHLANIFSPPATSGNFRWTAVNTPWNPNTATPNPAGTIETQAIQRSPVTGTMSARVTRKSRRVKHGRHHDLLYTYFARLSGQIRAGGEAQAGQTVQIRAGGRVVATAQTNSNGSFSKTLRLRKTTTFTMQATQEPEALVGATCDPRIPVAPGVLLPCGTVTQNGFTVSARATAKKPKRNRKHLKR